MGNKLFLKATALLVSSFVAILSLAGCTGTGKEKGGQDAVKEQKENKTPVSFKLWVPMHQNQNLRGVTDISSIACFQELERRTNVKPEYTSVQYTSNEDQKNKFNLMVAAGDLPDAFYWYNDGVTMNNLVENKVVIKLNDLVDKYGPNIKKVLESVKGLKKQTVDDNGALWDFPSYLAAVEVKGGLYVRGQIRRDWLNKLNLQMPETQEDWYKALKAFKENDPNGNGQKDEIPFSCPNASLGSMEIRFLLFNALGIDSGFFVKDGKAVYGPLEPEFKKGLEFGRRLVAEGLIDPDFMTQNDEQVNKKILNNQVGAAFNLSVIRVIDYKEQLKDKVPGYDMALYNFPKAPDGKRYIFHENFLKVNRGWGLYITSNSKKAEDITKWMDYLFTDEGGILMTFGLEGQHFEMVDGDPVMKDALLDPTTRAKTVIKGVGEWPCKDIVKVKKGEFEQDLVIGWRNKPDLLAEAVKIREAADISRVWPSATTFLPGDNKIVSSKGSEINTYNKEMFAKFMLGQEPLDNYGKYVEQLKKMGVEDLIKIYQSALDRYNKR